MIIDIQPGVRVNVPAQADFTVRTESSFSSGELGLPGTLVALEYQKFDGSQGEIEGTISNTDFLFLITPDLFVPGEWTINPRVKVSGYTRRWPQPAILNVGGPLIAGADCGC